MTQYILPRIVAELGINWQGDFNTLVNLADMAMGCGVDYVKLQLRTPELCVPKSQWQIPKQTPWNTMEPYIDYRKRMELSNEQLAAFDSYMKTHWGKHKWSASVFDVESLTRLLHFDIPYIKIPSAMLTDHLLLSKCIETCIPVMLSTGMSTAKEIHEAVEFFDNSYPLTIMHCNSSYPAMDREVNLRTIQTLADRYGWIVTRPNRKLQKGNFLFGFSSHSKSPYPAIYASVLGSSVVEQHVTLDRTMTGSDHAASLEKPGLELLCREIKRIPVLMGDGVIRVYESEKSARKKLRGK